MTEIKKITYTDNSGKKATIYPEAESSYGFYKNILGAIFGSKETEEQQVLSKIDTGLKNGYISAKEVSIFNAKLQEYAAKDGNISELSDKEAEALCKELGINKGILFKLMNLLGLNALNKAISEAIGKRKDGAEFEKLISEINGNNINDVLSSYNDGNLIKDIISTYKTDSFPYLNKLLEPMKEYAENRNIIITTLIEAYNKSVENKDCKAAQDALTEIQKRFEMSVQAEERAEKYRNLNGKDVITPENKARIENLAKVSGAPITEDLYGDGVLGNTPSKPAKGGDETSTLILNAVNELMEDPVIKERLQACVSKHENIITVILPGGHFKQAVAEGSLDRNQGRLVYQVIGDAEMSLFVDAIKEKSQKNSREFIRFDDPVLLKRWILALITP